MSSDLSGRGPSRRVVAYVQREHPFMLRFWLIFLPLYVVVIGGTLLWRWAA